MRYCSNCNGIIQRGEKKCSICGCKKAYNPNDKISGFLCVVSACFPIFGIIYWFIKHKDFAKRSLSCLISGMITGILASAHLIFVYSNIVFLKKVCYAVKKLPIKGFIIEMRVIFAQYFGLFMKGVGMTLLIALIGTVVGLIIGLLTGISRTTPFSKNKVIRVLHKILNGIIAVYIEVFRGTPMMVQAMVIYWGFAFMNGGQTLPLIPAGIFIVSINTGAYMAEIVRGGILSIDKGQFEGAYSVGMTHAQAMFHVVIPQVMRNILPSVSNEFVINIKDTSVLNVIGVAELYFMAGKVIFINLQIFQTYTIVCVLYFIMTFTVTRILRFCEKKLEGKKNYTIFGSQSNPDAEIRVKEEKK